MTTPTHLIHVQGLNYQYPKSTVLALQDAALSVGPGEVVALLGQNGSGKTTLVRHLNGLIRPTSAAVRVRGRDARSIPTSELARICGYVFQNPSHQIFHATVRDELAFAPKNFGYSLDQIDERITTAASHFQLADVLEAHPSGLDYTRRKLLTIASVYAYAPDVLILDEPTAGMDEVGRTILYSAIQQHLSTDRAVILVSHDMDYVARVATRAVVMSGGRIVGSAPLRELFVSDETLRIAHIQAPQITKLDRALGLKGRAPALSPTEFSRLRNEQTPLPTPV